MKKDRLEGIEAEYREGDMQRRLHLFLTYRDLRQSFMDIDAQESRMKGPVRDGAARSPGRCRRAIRKAAFAFGHLLGFA